MIEYIDRVPYAKKLFVVCLYGFAISYIVRSFCDHLLFVTDRFANQMIFVLAFYYGCILLYTFWWHSQHRVSDVAIKPWKRVLLPIIGVCCICFCLLYAAYSFLYDDGAQPTVLLWTILIFMIVTGLITLMGSLVFVPSVLSHISWSASQAATFKQDIPIKGSGAVRPQDTHAFWLRLLAFSVFLVFLVLSGVSTWGNLVNTGLRDIVNVFLGIMFTLVCVSGFFQHWPPQFDKADFRQHLSGGDFLLGGAGLLLAAFSGARVLLIPRHVWFVGPAEQVVNSVFLLLLWLLLTLGISWLQWRRDQGNASEPEDKTTVAQ